MGSIPATDRQKNYIQFLIDKKIQDPDQKKQINVRMNNKPLSVGGASKTIEKLLAMPDVVMPLNPLGDMADGIYKMADLVLKVYHTKKGRYKGRLKVKVYDPRIKKFYPAGKLTTKRALKDATPMNYEDARAFGKLYGICVVCSMTLTDEESIQYGIGPICRRKWGL